MKVGVISYLCSTHSGSRAPIDLAIALSKYTQVSFYAFSIKSDQTIIKYMQSRGINVCLLNKSSIPLIGSLVDLINLYLLLAKSKNDILTTHSVLSLALACWWSRIPTVGCFYGTQFNVLDERFELPSRLTGILNWPLNLIIYSKSLLLAQLPNRLVSISKYCANEAKRLYWRESMCIYLGNIPPYFPKSSNKSSQKITLLSVSRITPYKQFDLLIEAKKILGIKDVQLVLIGSSPQQKYLKYLRQVADRSTNILIDPPDKILVDYYHRCTIYLSADKYLFFGMPILEAATCGKPTIALDYAAASEMIVHAKTGFVAKDLPGLCHYLKDLIEHPKKSLKMGQQAKIRAKQKFNWQKCAQTYLKVFSSLRS